MAASDAVTIFRAARDFLLRHRWDYTTAKEGFRWPDLEFFDAVGAGNDGIGLWIAAEDGTETRISCREMADRSSRLANWLRAHGVRAATGGW